MAKDKQKDEFLDTVTHELRTPITAIRASSEILYDDDEIPEEMRKQFLHNIISESDRLNRLIDKILDLEKFETGKQKINLTEQNIVHTIGNSIRPLQQLISNKKIHLEFNENQKAVLLFYDEERMIQVITNLVSNAIKFCDDTNGIIIISFQNSEEAVVVNVFNNGAGVNANDLETIFEKFYQSSNQNIRKPIGSGLGLAICKQIIEAHKGRIWATNVQKGVTFSFTIPKQLTD
jgi:signal transduction histidine kinase